MKKPVVYFYLPANDDVYFDSPLVLAEGLKELGVPFFANRNYWKLSPDSEETLFKRDNSVGHQDADVVVIHDDWFYHYPQSTFIIEERPAPPGLFEAKRKYCLVYLDTWVGARTNSWNNEFRQCDVILRTQFNNRCMYPSNMKPWVLGFTNRIVSATNGGLPFIQRRRALVENFSYTHPYPHNLRQVFTEHIAPKLQRILSIDNVKSKPNPTVMSAYDHLMWKQSVDKHNQDYFNKLGSSVMVATFCGYLCPWLPADASVHFRGEKRYQLLAHLCHILAKIVRRTERVIQWDSWRFWETMCAGAVPLHIDLKKYGAAFPETPENWKHYIGVDLDHIDDFVDRLMASMDLLEQIGLTGHAWALQHYSPKKMAERFLEYVENSR